MLTIKRLLLCLSILLFTGVAQDAFAARFGLQTGFYNESLHTQCARTREFGLRLGFYADKTTNDIIYAAAMNGVDLCGSSGTCGAPQQLVAVPTTTYSYAPVGCSASVAPMGCNGVRQGCTNINAVVPPSCGSSFVGYAPAPQYAAAPVAPQQWAAPAPVVQQAAAPTKTEIYLLVLPESRQPVSYNQPTYYNSPSVSAQPQAPVADYSRQAMAPQGYYREPVEQQPVRGLW